MVTISSSPNGPPVQYENITHTKKKSPALRIADFDLAGVATRGIIRADIQTNGGNRPLVQKKACGENTAGEYFKIVLTGSAHHSSSQQPELLGGRRVL